MEHKLLTMAAAEGGTVTTTATHRIHTFTSSGTFTVNKSMNVEVLVVAGGGSGSSGGGGAGGLIYNSVYSVSPGTISVTVGLGGPAPTINTIGINGEDSIFDTLTAIGGGGGGAWGPGLNGGSGGGGGFVSTFTTGGYPGGTGTVDQGNNGGSGYQQAGSHYASGGGGGAGAAGSNSSGGTGGEGGIGLAYSITDVSTYYAGGGGGVSNNNVSGNAGGLGGGGAWNVAATPNTGGGGGSNFKAGGSGIVIVRYLLSEEGSIRITSTPSGAGIWLAPTGQTPSWQNVYTPDPITNLVPGNYDIRLTRSGYEDWFFGNATIIANTETQISATLTPSVTPANITATNIIATKDTDPCITGSCTLTIDVTWTNSGGTAGSIIPNITIDNVEQTPKISTSVPPNNGSITETWIITNLSAGTHTICPYPN